MQPKMPRSKAVDMQAMVATLVGAFRDDPVARHLFPEPLERRPGMEHIFRMGLRHGRRHGRVDVSECGGAVAIWFHPPNERATLWRQLEAGMLATPFVVGWKATRRMMRYERFVERARSLAMPSPHFYLFSIGVSPELQGRGLGTGLLRMGLDRARAGNLPCYLETSQPRNLPLYEKHGFRVIRDGRLPGADLPVWCLVASGG